MSSRSQTVYARGTRVTVRRRGMWIAGSLAIVVIWLGVVSWLRQPAPAVQTSLPAGLDPDLWHPAPGHAPRRVADDDQADAVAALPYLQGYQAAPDVQSVTLHDDARSQDGLNLVLSAHAPEAYLMDMSGRVLHRWRYEFQAAWPQRKISGDDIGTRYWRRVAVRPNGELLAIFDGFGLIKVDWNSKLLWAEACDCHHDLHVGPDGTVHVLSRRIHVIPTINPEVSTGEDLIEVRAADGRLLRSISLLRAFLVSRYAPLTDRISRGGDVFHTNSIEVLDGTLADRSAAFKKGNLLVSIFWLNAVAIVGNESEQVEWALAGLSRRQHEPSLLATGRLLLFDNAGRLGRSQVTELEPLTQEIVWQYRGDERRDLFSPSSGTAHRLPNGNTLITESTAGRALEVTSEGTLVWEFFNPHRAGGQQELIATLLDVERLDDDYFGALLDLETAHR